MSIYFLTGGTGAVGSAIVPVLLAEPDTEVRLLLRADSDAALAQRLEDLCLLYTSPSPRDGLLSRMPSSA